MAIDRKVAYALIDAELHRLRGLPYSKLATLVGNIEVKDVVGADGKHYQLEIQAVWDNFAKGADVRLIVAADNGGWSSFKPLTRDFIMRADGTLVGGP